MEYISNVGVYDYEGNKLCDLYDSQVNLIGQAYQIDHTQNEDGVGLLTFNIPYMVDKAINFRWNFLKSEYLVRLYSNNKEEWFVANKPVKKKTGKEIIGTVSCNGTPILLKTKNIHKEFDDENGIGTIDYLMVQILAGSGWHYDATHSDTLYEEDGVTEKVRSLNSNGSKGSLGLINEVCKLFMCLPTYDTSNKLVTIHAMRNRDMLFEAEVGKNLDALTASYNSNDIITRMYVEGEYDGTHGYVGIDDANPTGLSYIFNFDYYKEIGLFSETHEAAYQTYLVDITDVVEKTKLNQSQITAKEDIMNGLVGQCKLTVYYVSQGFTTPKYTYNDPTDEQKALAIGDEVLVLNEDGTYQTKTIITTPQALIGPGDYAILKYGTKAAGTVGAKEVQIEAKEKEIDNLSRKIAATTKEDKIREYTAEIAQLQLEIESIYTGGEVTDQDMKEDMALKYIPNDYSGNVDLFDRIIVPAADFIAKGYSFIGTYGTIFSHTFSAGPTDEYDYDYPYKCVIDITPIKADGTVLTQQQMEDYLYEIIEDAKTHDISIMRADDLNLVLRVDELVGDESLASAYQRADEWTSKLHEMQEEWDSIRASYNWFGETDRDPAGIFNDVLPVITDGLYKQVSSFVKPNGTLDMISGLETTRGILLDRQDEIEATFIAAMGDMLRDGKWQNNNYIEGQEQALYDDSVERMKYLSRPTGEYSFDYIRMHKEFGVPLEDIKINAIVRVNDDELDVHENMYVSKIVTGIDRKNYGRIEVSTNDLSLSSSDLGSLLSRMSQLADLIEQKNQIYQRAEAISKSGTFFADRLNGMIDVTKNQILSSVSNWWTDANGNIVFESVDGGSAMMLSGAGFMLADSKDEAGEWNWRTKLYHWFSPQ